MTRKQSEQSNVNRYENYRSDLDSRIKGEGMVATEGPIEVWSNDLHECVVRSIGKCAVRNLTILLKE